MDQNSHLHEDVDNDIDTERYLLAALEDIIANYPPPVHVCSQDSSEGYHGLWSGPTGIAYLLLHVSERRPDLRIAERLTIEWARKYCGLNDDPDAESQGCGIGNEKLAYEAVRCAIASRDGPPSLYCFQEHKQHEKDATRLSGQTNDNYLHHVHRFAISLSQISSSSSSYPDELLYGRAGAFYLARLVRSWVPTTNPTVSEQVTSLLTPAITQLCHTILSHGPPWHWHDRHYFGAVHGDIGILAQLVLTSPELAGHQALRGFLSQLLDWQSDDDGNWPSSEESWERGQDKGLVQFCHGAPGFVHSLLVLRKYFPELQGRIDEAIRRGQECVLRRGVIMKKEPSLCHGIFGNALALPNPHRARFLSLATPSSINRLRQADPVVFQSADYGRPYSMTAGYTPSAAWVWLIWKEEDLGKGNMVGFNDI
ncbi:uncharacterized protein C8A04DRAFT_39857 [Dichotomopilus funicola]|uniref:Uncharacterized protein n=1 Tax=Dichotomopilus funicola TaxID=1934379 RepID=A0AAN6UWV0_9PEZI|nr:hypothetical protein C8A04DRAFT_39857 [Dichotomopilus funicola]